MSVKGCKHSQHRTHDACQPLSKTFNKNLSKIGLLQPAHGSPTPTEGSARPENLMIERKKKVSFNWITN